MCKSPGSIRVRSLSWAIWLRRLAEKFRSVISNAISLRRVVRNAGRGTVLDGGALSLWCRAHFWTW